MNERTVRVDLDERSYSVVLGPGLLDSLGSRVRARSDARLALVVSVPPVAERYGARVARSLRGAGMRVKRFEVPDGDRSKSLRQVAKLYDAFLDAGADRSSVVVALGGGVAGDLAGFCAATLLRGVPFVQVPTTILAMVDSSVGGKTGVNLPRGKNLVGAFYQPELVLADTSVLESLPRRQRAAGLAEVIKHGAIWDPALWDDLEADVEAVLDLAPGRIVDVLARAVAVKAEVVSRDEREAGLRMILNFGHTLAHAVETLKRYRGVLHGEAVAMGMVYAAERSEALGFAPEGLAARLEALLSRAELPTRLPAFPRRAYLQALKVDKKKRDAHIRYVVLRGIGKAETVALRPEEIMPPGRRSGSG